uniref:Neuromedin U C-terminal domain-containing protein n=1 Tax=Urocitellus parryii TaxID=9999 RepID=A0A8D2GFD0_UROPR
LNQAVKMPLLPQFLPALAVYCFCMLQIPASGKGTTVRLTGPLSHTETDLDPQASSGGGQVSLLHLPTPLSDNQDIFKRFLFHYSRTQEPTYPVKTGLPAVHPLMRLASKLANGKMKRFPQPVCSEFLLPLFCAVQVHSIPWEMWAIVLGLIFILSLNLRLLCWGHGRAGQECGSLDLGLPFFCKSKRN